MLEILDGLIHVFHLSVILVNCTFWLSFKTLRLAQVSLTATFLSWVVGGAFYGWGYCFLTDWHWQLKETLGEKNLPLSYIKYVVDGVSGKDMEEGFINQVATTVLIVSLIGCAIQTIRCFRRRSKGRTP